MLPFVMAIRQHCMSILHWFFISLTGMLGLRRDDGGGYSHSGLAAAAAAPAAVFACHFMT